MDNVLLVANSVYQLFTAIHMRTTILSQGEAELILTDVTPGLPECRERLAGTGLFHRILLGETARWCKQYAGAKGAALDAAFQDPPSTLHWLLSDELGRYTAVYFANFDPFARLLACWFSQESCRFFCYEDGFPPMSSTSSGGTGRPLTATRRGGKFRISWQGCYCTSPAWPGGGTGWPTSPCPRSGGRMAG